MPIQSAKVAFLADNPAGPAASRPDGGASHSLPPRMVVDVIEDPARLAEHATAWEELAASAAEPNAFYEPWMLRPALAAFGSGRELLFALVYESGQDGQARGPLCGFFPLERCRAYKGLPVASLRLWQHLHCYLCTPLLRAGWAREALAAFLDWAGGDPRGAPMIQLGSIPADGPFARALVDRLNERQAAHVPSEIYNRALLERGENADALLQASVSARFRKEMRRLRKRLAEAGRLELRILRAERDFATWLAQFLELEAQGWKGAGGSGTAIALSPAESEFLGEIWRAALRRGRLQMIGLFLEDRPIALSADILAGNGGYHFKIAYDESLARFSPGVQLELELIRLAHGHPGVQWLDSCAAPDHFMMNRLWRGRRTLQTLVVSTGSPQADFLVSLLPALRCLKRMWRRAASRDPGARQAPRPTGGLA